MHILLSVHIYRGPPSICHSIRHFRASQPTLTLKCLWTNAMGLTAVLRLGFCYLIAWAYTQLWSFCDLRVLIMRRSVLCCFQPMYLKACVYILEPALRGISTTGHAFSWAASLRKLCLLMCALEFSVPPISHYSCLALSSNLSTDWKISFFIWVKSTAGNL